MINIPRKEDNFREDAFRHTVNLNKVQALKFARVREVLGGYSNQELLEILVDMAIERYDDGQQAQPYFLPERLKHEGDFAPFGWDEVEAEPEIKFKKVKR